MYVAAGKDIVAVEPESGRQIWRFEAPGVVSRRGVAYWPGDAKTPPRLYTGAGHWLIALDAKSGRLVPDFVLDPGLVELQPRHHRRCRGPHQPGVAAAVYENLLITGGDNGEAFAEPGRYGDIRGWDAWTGKLCGLSIVPRPGEPGIETWEGESWKNRSGTNVWLSAPSTWSAASCMFRLARRPPTTTEPTATASNLYGNSLVALDADDRSAEMAPAACPS